MALRRGQPRGRFDVLVPDDDGHGYFRYTSRKDRSLPRVEIIELLEEMIAWLKNVDRTRANRNEASRVATAGTNGGDITRVRNPPKE